MLECILDPLAGLFRELALVALLNGGFGAVHRYVDWFPANLQTVLGWVFRPIAWAMGVPWHDSGVIGSLLGTRMVLNEFIAFAQLGLRAMLAGTLANFLSATIAGMLL